MAIVPKVPSAKERVTTKHLNQLEFPTNQSFLKWIDVELVITSLMCARVIVVSRMAIVPKVPTTKERVTTKHLNQLQALDNQSFSKWFDEVQSSY